MCNGDDYFLNYVSFNSKNVYSLSTNWLGNKRKQMQNYVTIFENLFAENGELSVLQIANSLT